MEMESQPHTVNVLEECRTSPPSGSVPPTSLPLTLFDLVHLRTPPIQRLFFYELHHPKAYFINTILPNIKHSLSLTLQHFYPLAGNLTWPQESAKPQLVYKDGDTVSLTVAESDYDFSHLSGYHERDANMFTPLIPRFRPAGDQKLVPLLTLQVTVFPNEGICIGMSLSHVVSDGKTSTSFIKSWASACKGGVSSVRDSPQFFDRSSLKFLEPRELKLLDAFKKLDVSRETLHSLKTDHVRPVDKVRGTFVMSSSDIRRLKEWVLARLDKENEVLPKFHASSLVVTCAYVWVCLIKARWDGTDFGEAMEHIVVPIDIRGRLNPPVPGTYFGNCLGGVDVEIKRSDLAGEDGIAIATKHIGTDIQNFDIYRQLDADFSYLYSLPPEQIEGVASSPKFAVYETDFGWGKPKKAEISSIDTGQAIAFTECPYEEGALEIGLVRKKVEMDAFAQLFANYVKVLC